MNTDQKIMDSFVEQSQEILRLKDENYNLKTEVERLVNEIDQILKPNRDNFRQLDMRIKLLDKRILENPDKNMSFDLCERSAILKLLNYFNKSQEILKESNF